HLRANGAADTPCPAYVRARTALRGADRGSHPEFSESRNARECLLPARKYPSFARLAPCAQSELAGERLSISGAAPSRRALFRRGTPAHALYGICGLQSQ